MRNFMKTLNTPVPEEDEDKDEVEKRERKLKEREGGIKGDEKLHEESEKRKKD